MKNRLFDHWATGARLLKRFIANPSQVGTIYPSSRFLAEALLQPIAFDQPALSLVEVGPGTGPITRVILEKKKPEDQFLAFELDRTFYHQLVQQWGKKYFLNKSCEEILGHVGPESVDHIVSTLPWTNFSPDLQSRILLALLEALKKKGGLTTFIYLPGFYLPSAIRFRKLLRTHFESVEIYPVTWGNFPPAIVYNCKQKK